MEIFLFKQKTAYERRIRDWSSDVCSSDLISRVAGECAIMEIRSFFGSSLMRCSHSPLKYIAHSMSSSRLASYDSTMPVSGAAVVTSDQRVSLRRSSHGKSNRVDRKSTRLNSSH